LFIKEGGKVREDRRIKVAKREEGGKERRRDSRIRKEGREFRRGK
jgi:hypothetical protein